MSKPRLAPAAKPSPEAIEVLEKSPAIGGRALNIFGTLAHHPLLLKRYIALGGVFLRFGLLPARERELVILRTAWRTGSVYEFGQHTRLGQTAGVAPAEVSRLAQPGVDGWSPDDAALLAMVEDLHRSDRVSDPTWEALAARWSEAELVELLALAGFYRMTAGFLNSAGVELEAGVPGWPEGSGR
ncbi:MAG TPA: carboxymuconolactone decarboxylase family protein [Candidatus Dormibacteraeota bacterium]|nr:carboxymuconolactone decarboxylase family protein [Candidatus Dormibacteraeota bacterium]